MRESNLVVDVEETEARNDCAGEGQQQLTDRLTEISLSWLGFPVMN
jgi:hypothetical protein